MTTWFFSDTLRLGKERRAIEELAAKEDWLTIQRWLLIQFRMSVECVISVAGAEYPVRLIYPDQFPAVPAWVEPQDPNVKWSQHQYGAGGALCLELRPDNWVSSAMGTDVLQSAYNLLSKEKPLGDERAREVVQSAHAVGEVQAYGWKQPVMMGSGLVGRMRDGSATRVRAVQWAVVDEKLRTFVFDEVDRGLRPSPPPAESHTEADVFWTAREPPTQRPTTRAELAAGFEDDQAASIQSTQHGLVIFAGGVLPAAYHLIGSEGPWLRAVKVLADDAGVRSSRAANSVGKRVCVVGAGSIGSKVAECLVRSGVTRLRLVDGDVFLPGNLERHVLDWRDIGLLKTDALKRRLLMIAPAADVEVIDQNLNWQRSARTHAWQVDAISDCDIVVDATGDVPTALFLGAVASIVRKTFVSTVVFEGGLGALVAACVPDVHPSFAAARASYFSWCEEQGVAAPAGTGRRYEAFGFDGEPIVADDAAVTIAAGHTARVVLDCLDADAPVPQASWMLIGFRSGWIFKQHGDVVRLGFDAPPPAQHPMRDDAATELAIRLTQEAIDNARANRES